MRKLSAVLTTVLAVAVLGPPAWSVVSDSKKPAATAEPVAAAKVTAAAEPAGIPIVGAVVTRDGKPVPKAKVEVRIYKDGDRRPEAKPVNVSKDGKFSYAPPAGITKAWLSFTAIAPGFSRGFASTEIGKSDELKIALRPERKLKGLVVDEKGKPLQGVKLTVDQFYGNSSDGSDSVHVNAGNGGVISTTSGKDGSFVLSGIPDTEGLSYAYLNLTAAKPGRAMIRKTFQLRELSQTLKLVDPLECVMEGTLYLPGKAAPAPKDTAIGVRVPHEWGGDTRGALADKDGKFRVTGLPPGQCCVLFENRGYSYDQAGKPTAPPLRAYALPAVMGINMTPGAPIKQDLVMSVGAIAKGIATDKATGKPAANAILSVYHEGSPQDIYPEYAVTNDKGEFEVRVAAGQVTVALQQYGNHYYQPGEAPSVDFTALDGQDKTDIALLVEPSASSSDLWSVQNKPIPDDFELKPGAYDLTWNSELDCFRSVRPPQKYLDGKVTERLKAAPKFASEKVKLFAYAFDGTTDSDALAVALDESKGTGKGYDTAYIDRNRNWDLTDDEPIHFRTRQKYYEVNTDWVQVQSHQGPADGEHTDYPAQVSLQIYTGDDYIYASCQRKGGYQGTIETSAGKVPCALLDSNCDGIYGQQSTWKDSGEPDFWGDEIYIDTNGFGKLAMIGYGPHQIRINPISKVGNRFCLISANQLGTKLKIDQYAGATGTLLVSGTSIQGCKATADSLYVCGKNGAYSFESCDGKPVALPVGDYRISNCGLSVGSKGPSKLRIGGEADSSIKIEAGKQAAVGIAGKLSMAINPAEPEMYTTSGGSLSLSWIIKIGDYMTLNSIGDRNQSYLPKVKFFDKSGKVVYTTSANYT